MVAAALVAFHLVVVRGAAGAAWFGAGAGDSERVRAGEWWRAVTALALHVDTPHLLSNVVAGTLLLALVFTALGPGVGALAVLAAGAGGNLLNAWLQGGDHVAVGASTAVLGALGVLAGVALGSGAGPVGRSRWGWAPLTAALMLVVLTGLGPATDILAHLLGFAVGLPVGFAAARLGPRRGGRALQVACGLAVVATVVGCWAIARAEWIAVY
jgi:membrane associated rhomboid family serine protease